MSVEDTCAFVIRAFKYRRPALCGVNESGHRLIAGHVFVPFHGTLCDCCERDQA